MKIKSLIAALLLLSCHGAAMAEEGGKPSQLYVSASESLGLLSHVELLVEDEITDGCWTNVEAVKQKTRLTLEQSDVGVYTQPLVIVTPFRAKVIISALGMRLDSGLCVGDVVVGVYRNSIMPYGPNNEFRLTSPGQAFSKRFIFASGNNVNGQIQSAVDAAISELAADIISARRAENVEKMKAYYSSVFELEPMTVKEFERELKKIRSQD